jgi:hypothetical protein
MMHHIAYWLLLKADIIWSEGTHRGLRCMQREQSYRQGCKGSGMLLSLLLVCPSQGKSKAVLLAKCDLVFILCIFCLLILGIGCIEDMAILLRG